MRILGGIGYGTGLGTQVEFRCIVCEGEIEPALDRLGSLTCSLHRQSPFGDIKAPAGNGQQDNR